MSGTFHLPHSKHNFLSSLQFDNSIFPFYCVGRLNSQHNKQPTLGLTKEAVKELLSAAILSFHLIK